MSLLGELPVSDGKVVVNGNIGYSAQQAWVVSGSVRENVLFGNEYNKDRYEQTLAMCSLNKVSIKPSRFIYKVLSEYLFLPMSETEIFFYQIW